MAKSTESVAGLPAIIVGVLIGLGVMMALRFSGIIPYSIDQSILGTLIAAVVIIGFGFLGYLIGESRATNRNHNST